MAGQGEQDGGRRDSSIPGESRSSTSTFRPTVAAERRSSGVRDLVRGASLAPTEADASALTAFARQMGEQRRRSTAKMRAIQQADFGLLAPSARLLDQALGVVAGEHAVILADHAHRDWATAFELALAERGASAMRLTLEDLGALPLGTCPSVVCDALQDAAVVISALAARSGEVGLHRELELAASQSGARHLSMGGVSREGLVSSLITPCERTFEGVAKVARSLRDATRVAVRSPAGTDLTISLSRHKQATACGARPRSGEQLRVPFGRIEVDSVSIDGTYVADASVGELEAGRVSDGRILGGAARGRLTARPLHLKIERGFMTSVRGMDAAAVRAIDRFAKLPSPQRMQRWVLGANVGCSAALGEVAHDANLPGVHLMMGGEPTTGKAAPGLVFAMSHADVDVDGEALIRAGRIVLR